MIPPTRKIPSKSDNGLVASLRTILSGYPKHYIDFRKELQRNLTTPIDHVRGMIRRKCGIYVSMTTITREQIAEQKGYWILGGESVFCKDHYIVMHDNLVFHDPLTGASGAEIGRFRPRVSEYLCFRFKDEKGE